MSEPNSPPKSQEDLLKESLDTAEWAWLARHAERDAVIVVAPGIDLLDAGLKIARDDAATVQQWITEGKLAKPTREQLDAWNAAPDRKFLSLVVQPYVLVQQILS